MKHWFTHYSRIRIRKLKQDCVISALSLVLGTTLVCVSATAVEPRCVDLLNSILRPNKGSNGLTVDISSPQAGCIDLRGSVNAARMSDLQSAPPGKLVVVDKEALRNPVLVDSLAKSRTHLCFASPREVRVIEALLAAEVKQPKFFVLLPNHPNEIRAVWNLPHEQDVTLIARQMSKARPEWEKLVDATILGGQPKKTESISDALRQAIPQRDSDSNLIVIFGHNEDGVIRCPDGSTITVLEIQRLAEKRQSTAIVLSCDTINVVPDGQGILTTKRLQFDETAKVLQIAQARLAGQPGHSMGAFLNEVEGAFGTVATEATRRAIKLSIGVSGTILTVVAVVLSSDDEDEKANAPVREAEKTQ